MKDFKFPLSIQLFGEEAEADTTGEGTDSDNTQEPVVLTQADIDRAVSNAVKKRDEKHSKDLSKAIEDALAEERRKATLTEEQRQEEAREIANKAIEQREAELNQRLLRLDVVESLSAEGLSQEFLDIVIGKDLDDSNEKIALLKKIIDKQVENGIKDIVRKPGVPNKQADSNLTRDQIMKEPDQGKRQQLIKENMHLFEN